MLRLLLARLTAPFRWRTPKATARMLLAFARAERSSFYDMMAAANGCADLERRAAYVAHAVDENRHAQMFTLRALELWPALASEASLERVDFEHLYRRLGEALFIAFVHVGEQRGRAQMQLFRDELSRFEGTPRADTKTRALLDAVMVDEARHETYSRDFATQLGGSLTKARAWELGRGWLRVGSAGSSLVFSVAMSALYVLLAPLALLEQWRAR